MHDAGWVMANRGFGLDRMIWDNADSIAQAHVEGNAPRLNYKISKEPTFWRNRFEPFDVGQYIIERASK